MDIFALKLETTGFKNPKTYAEAYYLTIRVHVRKSRHVKFNELEYNLYKGR